MSPFPCHYACYQLSFGTMHYVDDLRLILPDLFAVGWSA